MALREEEWRGHTQWVCDEHRFSTLKESAARDHVAELHAAEAEDATRVASLAAPTPTAPTGPAATTEKKGKS